MTSSDSDDRAPVVCCFRRSVRLHYADNDVILEDPEMTSLAASMPAEAFRCLAEQRRLVFMLLILVLLIYLNYFMMHFEAMFAKTI